MKAYMRVEVGDTYPGLDCPPLPQANIDCVHRDEIGEIVSSILLKLSETSNNQALLIPFSHNLHEG